MYFIQVINTLAALLYKVLSSVLLTSSKFLQYCLRQVLLNNNDKNLNHHLLCARHYAKLPAIRTITIPSDS